MTYEARNKQALDSLHPSMRYKVLHLLELLSLIGEDILIYEGARSNEEQAALYAQGRTAPGAIVTNAKPGESFHNYGLAVDFAPVGPLGIPLKSRVLQWTATKRYEAIANLAKTLGLEWGGDWTIVDRPHLQYAEGVTLSTLRQGRRPNITKAREELLAYYQKRLSNAIRAVGKATPERKIHLERHIQELNEKVKQL